MKLTEQTVLEALRPIQDPDLRRSIVDLGFVQRVTLADGRVAFDLVLTTPACPVREQLQAACERAIRALPGVTEVVVALKAETRGAPLAGRKVLETVRNIVAIASGKGGVAKSTTAVNVAVALAQSGARVGILDADIYGPSVPMMLAAEEEPTMSAEGVIQPALALGLKVISIGFFIPPGRAAILRGPMASGYVTQFLGNVAWGELDYLIVDYPPGTGDIQLTLSQQAAVTAAVVCTTPQDISLIDVRKAIAMFETTKVPRLGVVETMSHFVCDGCGKQHALLGAGGGERIAAETGLPLLGQIPIDPRVVSGGDRGRPIVVEHPEAPAAEAYRRVAGAIAARLSTLHLEQPQALENFALAWDA